MPVWVWALTPLLGDSHLFSTWPWPWSKRGSTLYPLARVPTLGSPQTLIHFLLLCSHFRCPVGPVCWAYSGRPASTLPWRCSRLGGKSFMAMRTREDHQPCWGGFPPCPSLINSTSQFSKLEHPSSSIPPTGEQHWLN